MRLVGSLTTSNCRLVRLLPGVSDSKRQIPKTISRTTKGRDADELEQWLHQVYQPVNHLLSQILSSLDAQIDELAADLMMNCLRNFRLT